MRRWRTRVLMCLFLVLLCGRAGAMSAQSAVVIDADTGEVRYEHNADAVLPMASTTKIMTAIVASTPRPRARPCTSHRERRSAFGIPCMDSC